MARPLIQPSWRVLDLCCGIGWTTRQLSASCQQIDGVDFSHRRIVDASRLWPEGTFLEADAFEHLAQTPTGHYDAICLFDGLEHFERRQQALLLNAMERAVHPDHGRLILNMPNYHFLEWVKTHHPDKVQPVDDPMPIWDLMHQTEAMGFGLLCEVTYGIEAPHQYQFFAFDRGITAPMAHNGGAPA